MSSLHSKIYTAKKLVLKKVEIDNKRNTFATLSDNFNLSKESLIDLHKDGLIVINDCVLSNFYIIEYHERRKKFETQQWKGLVASGSGHNPQKIKGWDSYFTDKYCGLKETIYQELLQNGKIDIDILDFENTINNGLSPLDFISFNLEIYLHLEKLEEFLNKNTDLFRRDELDLSDDKARRFLSYEMQKEYFAIAITKEINKGYSPNNLKIDYTQIWQKDFILQTNFLQTAMAMEKEGLIEIKDIIEQMPKNLVVITSDTFWKYPTIIQVKILPDFYKYYDLIYKKANPVKEDSTSKKEEIKQSISETKPIENLSPINFLSICDVAMDIKEELQMTDKNTIFIPVIRTIIRPAPFNILFPADSVGTRDNYGKYRIKAMQYLLASKSIMLFKVLDSTTGNRWDEQIMVMINEKDFDSFYDNLINVYEKRVVEPNKKQQQNEGDRIEKTTDITKTQNKEVMETQRPYCVSENGIGYLKFGKDGEKIEIGKIKNQPFKLLQCLSEPFEIAKSVDSVFEAIRENVKKKSKVGAYTSGIDRGKKVEIIEYTIKELQKGNKLKGKLEFKWNDIKTLLQLKYTA